MTQQNGIFAGLKVVDLASFIAGPAATTILADFGATVIKVEPPHTGDPFRYLYKIPPNPPSAENYPWQMTNRNKRSLALDLKRPGAASVLAALVKWADVLVTNFPPRVRKSLGLDYTDLSPLNDRLIYGDLTGYGELGPEANKPGFDITAFWARSGLMQFTRDASSPPAIPVPGIGDNATAISLYAAVVTGLYRRERTGKGCQVSTSLIANGAWATSIWLQAGLSGATFSGELDRKNPPNATGGASYRTADDRWVLLCFVEEEKNWPVFAAAVGREDLLSDTRFASTKARLANAALLVAELDRLFGGRPLAYWKQLLDGARLPYGVVQIPEEIVSDPQLLANGILVPIAGEAGRYTVDSPFTVKQDAKTAPRPAPGLGEHSAEILQELGFDDDSIRLLRRSEVVDG